MKVLVADDEAVARLTLTRVLERHGYEVLTASHGTEALALALSDDAPRMIILDWMMPGLDGVEICRRLRARVGAPYVYIMVSGRSRQQDVLLAMEAGVDDFITKPYDVLDFDARVRVGERVLAQSQSPAPKVMDVLREALASPGGEVIVRQGDAVGRIHVVEGRFAWAHLSTEPGSILDALGGEAPVSREDMATALEEARTTRRSVGDILVEWELVDAERLRAAFQVWITKKLAAIFGLAEATVVFVPQAAAHPVHPTFAFDEVCPLPLVDSRPQGSAPVVTPQRLDSLTPPVGEPDPRLVRVIAEVQRIQGVLTAATLDVRIGYPTVIAGDQSELNLDLARAQLRVMALVQANDQAAADDLILTTSRLIHITRCVPARPGVVVHVVLNRESSVLGFARMTLKALVEGIPAD